jgi:hypothetical protein
VGGAVGKDNTPLTPDDLRLAWFCEAVPATVPCVTHAKDEPYAGRGSSAGHSMS